MSYIKKGDAVKVRNDDAVAASDFYTKMVYDSHDIYMNRKWKEYEGGTACIYIDVEYPNGMKSSVPASWVIKG